MHGEYEIRHGGYDSYLKKATKVRTILGVVRRPYWKHSELVFEKKELIRALEQVITTFQ